MEGGSPSDLRHDGIGQRRYRRLGLHRVADDFRDIDVWRRQLYPITQGSLTAGNYTITFAPGQPRHHSGRGRCDREQPVE